MHIHILGYKNMVKNRSIQSDIGRFAALEDLHNLPDFLIGVVQVLDIRVLSHRNRDVFHMLL